MNQHRITQLALVGFSAAAFACTGSSDDGDPIGATGGSTNPPSATGGSSVASGGTQQGGSAGSSANTGGAGGSGPTLGTGGVSVSTGGLTGATGGAGMGGTNSGGGALARGGSAGQAGSSGGAGGSGGSTPTQPPKDPIPSSGCGASTAPMPCSTSGSPCKMDVSGTEREFYVVLPSDYSASRAYPVVFQFHPLGGNAEQGMNMYRIRANFPQGIYVTPNGLISGSNRGFPNTNGQDEAMTRAIMADIEAKYCVDKARYFSTGFSYGGSMSYQGERI